MKIYDISMTIEPNMQVYKNKEEKKPQFITRSDHKTGKVHETTITIDLHTGTHIDAPLHMIKGGDTTEIYNLDTFYSKCKVFDFTHKINNITKEDLVDKEISEGDFILLKTTNSLSEDFIFDFIYLEKDAAKFLQEKRIKAIGIDGLGIEREQPNYETHRTLLSNNIMIVEGLRLKDVPEGEYTILILPLKIANVEASPARAILIQE